MEGSGKVQGRFREGASTQLVVPRVRVLVGRVLMTVQQRLLHILEVEHFVRVAVLAKVLVELFLRAEMVEVPMISSLHRPELVLEEAAEHLPKESNTPSTCTCTCSCTCT